MDNIVEARNNMHARNAKKERDKKHTKSVTDTILIAFFIEGSPFLFISILATQCTDATVIKLMISHTYVPAHITNYRMFSR